MKTDIYTRKEAAELLGITYQQLTILIYDNKIDHVITGSGRRMLKGEHIDKYLKKNEGFSK